jgi:hypothetical protein
MVRTVAPLQGFSQAKNTACQVVITGSLCHSFEVTATNVGSVSSEGPIVVRDRLPVGFSVSGMQFLLEPAVHNGERKQVPREELAPCQSEGEPVTLTCTYPGALAPDEALELWLLVTVAPGVPSGTLNTASATGPDSAEASVSEPMVVDGPASLFGASDLLSYIAGVDGALDTQAGDHPYELTTRFDLNNVVRPSPEGATYLTSVQDVKDVIVDLPPGVVGDAQATPKCTFAQLATPITHCPFDTRVGQIVTEPEGTGGAYTALYNMVPERGVAAEFGFYDALYSTHAIYAGVAPTPGGYVVRATTREVPQVPLTNGTVTLFGDSVAKDETENPPVPFFTNPSDCSGAARVATLHLDSWQEPGPYIDNGLPAGEPLVGSEPWTSLESSAAQSPPVTGCSQLRFKPNGFSVRPDTTTADSPTGLTFDLRIPQIETPDTLATPPLRDASVTLPAGLTVDPSAASGLAACSVAQIGWLGRVSATNAGLTNFTPGAPACPEASKIGSVEVTSPLVENTLQGSVYLATQYENPFGSLLAGYIVIDDPATGTIIKVPGELKTDPTTGQITGVFDENPQIPFSELKLHFFGGPRGDLVTPEGCGTFTTTSDLMPWSAPESGPDATPSDSFQIDSGCVSGFAPMFHAGTVSPQAGGFSPFTLSFSRNDNEEGPAGLTVSLPTGLLGKITGVGECSDAQLATAAANSGAAEQANASCPASSLLGSVQAASGPGPNPFVVGGKAYFTGPYKGAPYGVAVVVPAVAGPFDLGTVVIRQALYIDPRDSHVTDVSDPLPTILRGIPLHVKRISVTLDRPGFTFNPTSCEQKAITGTATSIGGAQAALSSRFQAAGCTGLAFHPVFTVSTRAKTSKKNGASLVVKTTYPQGAQANIRGVAVTLPKQLPSRLTTIQQACPEAAFAQNPASCPAGSNIGVATASTPVLANPVSGPAYLVSHGGAAFPDVVVILQGEGVTVDLVGNVNIKKGVTSSDFAAVPDAPISSFQLSLPEGPHSALAAVLPAKAKGNMCAQKLSMPFTITGQNGAVLKQNVKIAVTGCPKAKQKAHKPKKKRKGGKK